ncbi:hypothetical protein CMV_012849 [Castanea mollissima]|uniref:Uncharacterized protein n=1 Tax=Castanea mollissima TaxID=60419 RepID=A0A8J4R9J5_9ROSI|nr:hypothetical protein CMV_012849 [Castanea mollissima]
MLCRSPTRKSQFNGSSKEADKSCSSSSSFSSNPAEHDPFTFLHRSPNHDVSIETSCRYQGMGYRSLKNFNLQGMGYRRRMLASRPSGGILSWN